MARRTRQNSKGHSYKIDETLKNKRSKKRHLWSPQKGGDGVRVPDRNRFNRGMANQFINLISHRSKDRQQLHRAARTQAALRVVSTERTAQHVPMPGKGSGSEGSAANEEGGGLPLAERLTLNLLI